PSFYWVNTSSNFMGAQADESRLKFNVGSIGMVNAITSDKSNGIVGAAFAVGYNTLVNYNNSTVIRGLSENSSLLDDFTWHANADPDNLSPFYEQLAFDTYLMPYDETAEAYWHDMQLDGYGQQLYRSSQQSGYIGEYSLSGAFNFSNLLYFGATVGIHAVRFYEDIYHTETDHDDHVLDFDSFRFREFNSTRGWGYTARFGMILRPIQLLRIGASFQLPTYYHLTDEKYTDMNSYWDSSSGIEDASEGSPNGIYDYKLKTPFRANANASLILSKIATLSAGYEYVDYSAARLDAYDYKFFDENDQIRQDFRVAHNLKAGAEIRLNALYLRGGMQYLMSPFTDTRNDAESWVYSGGFGIRTQKVYFDMSYSRFSRSEVYGMYAYAPGANEVSLNDINGNNLMFTVGFKF
ncbi:MAG: outer membrane protein transport protein, partial [Bacteroidales bacterium]|nr:outer membrane protein transport protein [Bacteroidales bacterium]